MKKKLIASILAGVMGLSLLAGCGASASKESKDDAKTEEASGDGKAAADSIGTVTLILGHRDEFQSTLESGALKIAKEMGINLVTQNGQDDSAKQLQYVEAAANAGQKAIIIVPVDPATCPQLIESAGDMKVVFMNVQPTDLGVLNENVCYVGSNEMESGYFQGQALAEKFKAEGKKEAKYILLQGTLGQVATTNRSLSFIKGLEDNGIKAVEATAPLVADWDRANAQDMVAPLLKTIEYDCIVANNDAMALGAIEALKSAGIDPKTVPVCGIDATVDGCTAVSDESMFMTVFQDADGQGRGALVAAANMIKGKAINDSVDYQLDKDNQFVEWIPFAPVNKDNVKDFMKK